MDPRSSITCQSGPRVLPMRLWHGDVASSRRSASAGRLGGCFSLEEEIDRLVSGRRMVGAPVSSFVPDKSSRSIHSRRVSPWRGRSSESRCDRGSVWVPIPSNALRGSGPFACDLPCSSSGRGISPAAISADVVMPCEVERLDWAPESGSGSGSTHPR